MRTGVLFGESEINEADKKLNRVTSSFDDFTMNFIDEIAQSKSLSHSEIVNRLCKSKISEIVRQTSLIEEDPQTVAFDLVTKI